jgi:hypothetical protein
MPGGPDAGRRPLGSRRPFIAAFRSALGASIIRRSSATGTSPSHPDALRRDEMLFAVAVRVDAFMLVSHRQRCRSAVSPSS